MSNDDAPSLAIAWIHHWRLISRSIYSYATFWTIKFVSYLTDYRIIFVIVLFHTNYRYYHNWSSFKLAVFFVSSYITYFSVEIFLYIIVQIQQNINQMQHFIITNLNLFPSKVVKWLPQGSLFYICIYSLLCCSVLFADHWSENAITLRLQLSFFFISKE